MAAEQFPKTTCHSQAVTSGQSVTLCLTRVCCSNAPVAAPWASAAPLFCSGAAHYTEQLNVAPLTLVSSRQLENQDFFHCEVLRKLVVINHFFYLELNPGAKFRL